MGHFPGFTTLQLCDKTSDLLSSMGQTPAIFTGILFKSMFNDIFCDRYDNKDECLRNANIVKTFAGRFGIGQWSFIGPGSEKKWYPSENNPQGAWDNIAEQMLLEFAESGHPIFRAPTPLSRGQLKSKGRGKLSIHFTADYSTIGGFQVQDVLYHTHEATRAEINVYRGNWWNRSNVVNFD